MKDFLKFVQEFLKGSERNKWFESDLCNVYLRKSQRFVEGKMSSFLDVANCTVFEQRKGTFTNILNELKKLDTNLYIESVLNPAVTKTGLKCGFKIKEISMGAPHDMYLLNDRVNK